MPAFIMTQSEARKIIANFTGNSVTDAYISTEILRSIVYALPSTDEALDFLYKVQANANTETTNGFGANFKRLKRAALKITREIQDNPTLF